MWKLALALLIIITVLALIGPVSRVYSETNGNNTMQTTNLHRILASQTGWLNTSRAITAEDLQGRVILLDFWTFCCINCMHVIPDLKYLEETFGDKLTVIGVHSAKFKNEKDTENIRSAILRYGIEHPVVNDFDFSIWNKFGVRAWPTFILINPQGTVEATYSGEGNREEAQADIAALIEEYGNRINTAPLPIALESAKKPPSALYFPGKLAEGSWGNGDETYPVLYVSDSGHHRILAMLPNGAVQESIGSGAEGFKDGSFEEAKFRRPQGVLFSWPRLYIADTENHSLRVADLMTRQVTTLAGTGKQGHERRVQNAPALSIPLASPWDLAFYPDDTHIAIAMAGTHQLWSYDIENKTVSVIAGSGRESIDDGKLPFNSLSQPSGLSAHDGKLYFVDSETSSLRVYDNGAITTLIGTGLFDFGFKDGKQGAALMQHSLGVYADDSGVYIADSYNHSIRHYNPKTGALSTFAGHGVRGAKNGAAATAEFNEPNDLLKIGETFYVADTNNHAIRMIENGQVSSLAVKEADSVAAFSDNLPNLETMPPMDIASGATVEIALQAGWKINDEAPSALTLFSGDKKAVASFGLKQVKTQALSLPPLADGAYRLQGTLYYCEDKEGSQCLIKSFDAMLNASARGEKRITLRLN